MFFFKVISVYNIIPYKHFYLSCDFTDVFLVCTHFLLRYIVHNYISMEVHSYSYESFLWKDLAFLWPPESRLALRIIQAQHSWELERMTGFSAFLKPLSFLQYN